MNGKLFRHIFSISYVKKCLLKACATVWQLHIRWICMSFVISICAGCASALFLHSLDWVTAYRERTIWIISLLPVGGLLIGLLYHYWGKGFVNGNHIILTSIHQPTHHIPFLMAPFIYVGTIATHLFGGSAGREGTALQMAGAITDPLGRWFYKKNDDRTIWRISAIGAGFGSIFGTPLAGAIFSLEFIFMGKINYRAILPTFLSSIMADQITQWWGVHHTAYHIPTIPAFSMFHLLYAVCAGLAFGCCARLFMTMMDRSTHFLQKYIAYTPIRTFFGGIVIIVGVWGVGTTDYVGLGIPTILRSFNESLPAYTFILKMLFTVLTLSTGFKGGEATPLFFIGASLGSALSSVIPLPTALLSGMGFVSVFAACTNTPLACTIMAAELFGSSCVIYIAIACIVSYLVSGHASIYKGQKIREEPKHPSQDL